MNITIEEIEALVSRMEQEEEARRAKLIRLISAEARIIALREPEHFGKPRATERSDEDGHWDNSFPPEILCKNRTGPRLITVEQHVTDDIATSSGFYHDWKRVTTDPGLFIGRKGELYGLQETGTGSFGQFAAHPGNCDVQCDLDWQILSADEVSTERLEAAEEQLRALAFPLSHADA